MCYLSIVSQIYMSLIGYEEELPFTLSAFMRLERLSISAQITRKRWALPEIIRLINTTPASQTSSFDSIVILWTLHPLPD